MYIMSSIYHNSKKYFNLKLNNLKDSNDFIDLSL